MTNERGFNFSNAGVSTAYDDVLVPLMFKPWAEALLRHVAPPEGANVVDVASGTGIVAQKLADRVGPRGSVTAVESARRCSRSPGAGVMAAPASCNS